jgi:hypothetical protein
MTTIDTGGSLRSPADMAVSALNYLMQDAEIIEYDRRQHLVAALSPRLVDVLIHAAGSIEDLEDSGDEEPDDEDTGIDDVAHDEPHQDLEPTFCGATGSGRI